MLWKKGKKEVPRDYQKERLAMVEEQLRRRGISDPRVLEAMGKVPRHLFLLDNYQDSAYEDRPLPIGEGQTISPPYMVAIMTQSLELKCRERVLEIGTGSGYQTAILAELAEKILTIERIPTLTERAKKVLGDLGYPNISFRSGDGSRGWPEEGPFDGIMVTAGSPDVPPTLKSQLAEGGRLVIPTGPRYTQTLYKLTREGDQFIDAPCPSPSPSALDRGGTRPDVRGPGSGYIHAAPGSARWPAGPAGAATSRRSTVRRQIRRGVRP